ncbi:MAB_1171c family putative transporter [Streptomyces sp. NPDC001478]
MSENASNVVYLCITAITFLIGCWKALALLRDSTPTLALTTAMFLCASVVYLLASPAGYTALGNAVGWPSFATLPVYIGIMSCFAFLHLITFLWSPELRQTPAVLHRAVARWSVAYAISAALMIVFFTAADLSAPADPLRFNTEFADEPQVLLFLGVFLATLSSGTLNTYRRCRRMQLDDPRLQHSLRVFGIAMLGIFGYVVCSAPAIVFAAAGYHGLDAVGVFGSTFGAVGTVIMCYGLSGSALGAWLRERRDTRALQPLWDLVVADVDSDLAFSMSSARNHPLAWNTGFNLHRTVIEILDGIRSVRPWVSKEAAEAVYNLYALQATSRGPSASTLDIEAAATAAALRDAVDQLQAAWHKWSIEARAGRPKPPEGTVNDLPGDGTRASDERKRLLRVAQALNDPLVTRAVQTVQSGRAASVSTGDNA